MNPRLKWALIAGGVVGLALVGYVVIDALYTKPAAELRASIDQLAKGKDSLERSLLQDNAVRRALDEIIASAVGGDRQSLEHRLRTAGSALAVAAGLEQVEVNSLPPQAMGNPAASVRGMRDRGFQRTLREQVDAMQARVAIEGRGTLEGVFRALAMAEAQRWTIGVDSWSIKPERVEEGQTAEFSLNMALTVLIVDDEGAIEGEIPIEPTTEADERRVATLVAFDPFRTAPPPPPVAVSTPVPDPEPIAQPPAAPAGDGWSLRGVIEGESGKYAILVHRDGRRRTLALGQDVGGLRLYSVAGEAATFEVDNERFEVRNGEALVAARKRRRP